MYAGYLTKAFLAAFLVCILWLISGPAVGIAQGSHDFSVLEQSVFEEINRVRTDPGVSLSFLTDLRRRYVGKQLHLSGNFIIQTREGVRAVDQAIRSLDGMNPMRPLRRSEGMSRGARDHVLEQGPKGGTGHLSLDGRRPWDRINRYGAAQGQIAENIAYGRLDARMMVMSLIIDDGVPDRGHRKNIFNPDFGVAGVACGGHGKFGIMCVVDFAGEYIEKGGSRR